jgi:PTS system nitrogen regulatory IIA component
MASLETLLHPDRVVCRADAASKKRVLELVAAQIAGAEPNLQEATVYTSLLERERLGTTALGAGVAVPHCRVPGIESPLGCLVTLAAGVDFDAPDGETVDLLFVLLVPPEATQEHLDILAAIARRFSDAHYCRGLREAADQDTLLQAARPARAA